MADEVRTLASRTQQSTAEIELMIDKLQNGSRQAEEVMKIGRGKAISSVEQTNQAGTVLKEITIAVEKISDMNTNIASAAEEQATVASGINNSINTVNTLAKQNITGANKTTESSAELSILASQ